MPLTLTLTVRLSNWVGLLLHNNKKITRNHKTTRNYYIIFCCRWRLRRIVESLIFRLTTFFLIFLDVIIVIVDLVENSDPADKASESLNTYEVIDLVLTLWFVVELILRIVALTPAVFFARYLFFTFSFVCVSKWLL